MTIDDDTVAVAFFIGEAAPWTGTVWGWGDNSYGQLGDGTQSDRTSPVRFGAVADVRFIAAGYNRSYAVTSQGAVWACGENWHGGLGIGNTTDQAVPCQVVGLSDVVAVVAGYSHTHFLRADGSVWACGTRASGALGMYTEGDVAAPVQVPGLADIVGLTAGHQHSLALDANGDVWAWGCGSDGRLGTGITDWEHVPIRLPSMDDVVAVGAGYDFSLAVKSDGTVWAWGRNDHGQLGIGTQDDSLVPVQVSGLGDIVGVSGGEEFGFALSADGAVWAWGVNSDGQLGDGTHEWRLTPVPTLTPTPIVEISSGKVHAVALDGSGSVWAWGSNQYGQLATGTPALMAQMEPVRSRIARAVHVAAGNAHTLVLVPDAFAVSVCAYPQGGGTVARSPDLSLYGLGETVTLAATAGDGWEFDGWLSLPDGAAVDGDTAEFDVEGDVNVLALFRRPGLALTTLVWQREAGSVTVTPDQTSYDPGDTVTLEAVAEPGWTFVGWEVFTDAGTVTSDEVTLVFDMDGDTTVAAHFVPSDRPVAGLVLACGGWQGYGVGRDTTSSPSVPMPMFGPDAAGYMSGALAVTGGDCTSIVLGADGTAWGVGTNGWGQLGDGTTTTHRWPEPFGDPLGGVVAVGGGVRHLMAVTSDGEVWTCGYNGYGVLGDGTTTQRYSPVQVGNLGGIVAVDGWRYQSVALREDGSVWTWGLNDVGQLGDGSWASRCEPGPVRDSTGTGCLTGVVGIAAGGEHMVAVKSDGTAWAWGSNVHGQLGDGTCVTSNLPVQVVGPGGEGVLTDVVEVGAGVRFTAALRSDGTVWTWGRSLYGQLGDGTYGHLRWSRFPVQVRGPDGEGYLTDVATIAVGNEYVICIKTDGTVWGWGRNDFRMLGNDASGHHELFPVQMQLPGPAMAIGVGAYHSLVVVPQIEVTAELDWDWVYQNGTMTTEHRHLSVLTITIGDDPYGSPAYAITINTGKQNTDGVLVEATANPRVWRLRGGRAGIEPVGDLLVGVAVEGLARDAYGGTAIPVRVRYLGDIDGSGSVTAQDKQFFNQRLNGVDTSYPDRCYDLTGDGGAPTAEDKQVMNKVLNGIPTP